MLLPCPECQTVYNAEPSVYKPGMAFQCVSCGAVVVVPEDDAQAETQGETEPEAELQVEEPAASTDPEQGDGFDFDLELPSLDSSDEPQPTMVFDPSSLEDAVSEAFGKTEGITASQQNDDISDDFFDSPLDDSGQSIPAPFTPSLDIDAQATRQFDAGDVSSGPSASAELQSLSLDGLEQPTMVLSSREAVGGEPAAVPSGVETRVLESSKPADGLDAVDLLDDLFDNEPADVSGLSLPQTDALSSEGDSKEADSGFDLTDDIFGSTGSGEAQPEATSSSAESPSDPSGLSALDFDDLVNQPLGSDDVSFSFDDLSSIGGPESSPTQTPSDPLHDGAQAQTQVLSHEPDSDEARSPTAAPQTAWEAKASHTWVGLGLVVVALALIASTADIASLLDGGLKEEPTPRKPKAEAEVDNKTGEAARGPSDARPTPAAVPSKAQSVDAIFSLDFAGLVRVTETNASSPALKALAQYRLSRYFGESKRLAEASKWRQDYKPSDSAEKTETIVALGIGAVLAEFRKASSDSAELILAKKETLEPFEKALVASALSGPKQKTTSVNLFKEVLSTSPTSVEIWDLFLAQHNDRGSRSWADQTLSAMSATLSDWEQARFIQLFLKLGKPQLVMDLLLNTSPDKVRAPESLSESDKLSVARLEGFRALLRGDLGPWQTFATLRQKSRPNLENFIAQSRVDSLISGKISPALIERARNEKAPVVQARYYYEAALLGRDLGLEKETAPLVKEMVQSLSPTKTGGYFQLARGELALLMGNRPLARRFIAAALKINPRLTEASLASLMLIDRDKDIFLRELTKLHQRGDSSRVSWQLARVFSERNNHGGALRLIESLLVQSPTVAPLSTLLLSLLDNLVANGDYGKLTQLAEQLHLANPKDKEVITLMVEAASPASSTDFPDRLMTRVKWTERLHKLNPANRDNLYGWVEAMLDAEKQTEARDVLKALLDEFPDARGTARFTQLIARSWIAENPSVARQFLKESVRYERIAKSHVLLGEIEEKRQSQVDAIEQYLLAIELEPSLTEIRFRVGRLLHEVGRYPEASAQLEVVVNSNPANAVARELLGDTFREQGEWERALKQYRRVLEQGNLREALLMKTARLQMYELNRLEDAVRSLQQAALLNDKNSEILYLLGVALKDLNQLERARRQFQKYLRLDPNGDYAEEVRGILKNL